MRRVDIRRMRVKRAAESPAGPAPMMMTSQIMRGGALDVRCEKKDRSIAQRQSLSVSQERGRSETPSLAQVRPRCPSSPPSGTLPPMPHSAPIPLRDPAVGHVPYLSLDSLWIQV